jgi:hypothetical protein
MLEVLVQVKANGVKPLSGYLFFTKSNQRRKAKDLWTVK